MTATFNVTRFEPRFDGQLAVLWDQQLNAVKCQTQHFRLAASVEVSLDGDETYEIGFIQVLATSIQSNSYTSGTTQRWEIYGSKLDSDGRSLGPVNDSDIDRNIPWYNTSPARIIVRGPTTKKAVQVEMDDDFHPNVAWTEAGVPTSYLHRIFRQDLFDVWLVAHRSGPYGYTALKHVRWQLPVWVDFTFDYDGTTGTSKPNHSSWLDRHPTTVIMEQTTLPPIPPEAFLPPRYNYAMALYRYPADGSPKQFLTWADGRPGMPPG